jgi:hypothetical protein
MTRKTGLTSDFTFSVAIWGGMTTVVYFNKTYTFSALGTMNVTDNITLPDPSDQSFVFLEFRSTTGLVNTTKKIGAGITNVRF